MNALSTTNQSNIVQQEASTAQASQDVPPIKDDAVVVNDLATSTRPPVVTIKLEEKPVVAKPASAPTRKGSASTSNISATIPPFEIEAVPFPASEWAARMEQDDLKDGLLMTICSAFASVDNRALCPKEIAAVCMKLGWKCTGSQPFAVVSSAIRSHLRRRGMTATNSSNGRPFGPNLPPPLFASYELAGIPDPEDVLAMGIKKDAKPAVKRGTLWYLSTEGTGYASPFGERDPNLPGNIAKQPIAARNKVSARRASLPASQSLPNLSSFPAAMASGSGMSPTYEDDEEGEESMGRGKRKRKASSIAGGDSSWQTSHNKHNLTINTSISASPPPSTSQRRSASIETANTRSNPALERTASGIKRIKVRLSSLNEASPTAPSFDSAMDSDSDAIADSSKAAAQEKRRTKKRSKSEGSLLSFAPAAMHYRPPASATTTSSRSSSPVIEEGHARAWSAEPVSRPRQPSLLDTLIGRRLQGDVEMRPVDETDEEDDDFHEAILKSDFDFEFDFAFGQRKLAAARRRMEGRGGSMLADEMEMELLDEDLDTPATTPRSPILEVDNNPELYDLANEAAKNKTEAGRNGEMILLGLEDASGAVQETLAEAYSPRSMSPPTFQDDVVSPASPLPPLPIVKAATSAAFGPAGNVPEDDELAEGDSLASSFSDLEGLHPFGNQRSFSPTASSISSFNAESEMQSQAASPACSNDSFDAEVVIGGVQDRLKDELDSSLSPSALGIEDLVTVEDAQGEDNLHIVLPTDVAMDELDLEFGGPVTPPVEWDEAQALGTTPPPTPFGPEVYGFFSAPQMEWHAPTVVTPICDVDSAIGLELGPGLEDVEMDSQAETEKLRAELEAATSAEAVEKAIAAKKSAAPEAQKAATPKPGDDQSAPAPIDAEATSTPDSPPAKPVLQRKTSIKQLPDTKTAKDTPKTVKATPASTRSTRANPKLVKEIDPAGSPEQAGKPVTRRSSRRK